MGFRKKMTLLNFILLILASVGPSTSYAKGNLIVVSSEWCPYACGKTDEYKGYLVELLAQSLPDFQIEYKVASRARSIRMIEQGQADIVLGIPSSGVKGLALSQSVSENIYCLYSKAKTDLKFADIKDLKGKKIGIVEGYNYPEDFDAYFRTHPKEVSVGSGAVAALNNYQKLYLDRIQVFIENKDIAQWWFDTAKSSNLKEVGCRSSGGLHYGIKEDRVDAKRLIDEMNKNLASLKKNGVLLQLRKKYQFKQ